MEVPVSATNEAQNDATKMDTDNAPNDTASGAEVNMDESKNVTDTAEGAENGSPPSEEKSVPMDTDAKVVYRLHVDCSLAAAVICKTHLTDALCCLKLTFDHF